VFSQRVKGKAANNVRKMIVRWTNESKSDDERTMGASSCKLSTRNYEAGSLGYSNEKVRVNGARFRLKS